MLSVATEADRHAIYRLRHEVYGLELRQHRPGPTAQIRDALDDRNIYLVASVGAEIAGFISLTPPGGAYSLDKYLARERLPFELNGGLYEVRLLTVLKPHRGRELATLLMYAAFRWVESHGGSRIAAIGRREVVEMYRRCGLQHVGISVQSGAVTFDVLTAATSEIRDRMKHFGGVLDRIESNTDWRLSFPFQKPAACYHGGAFFEAVGPGFDSLERAETIINADVLDAWFPPSPKVLDALRERLPWLLRTSPPTDCSGLVSAIATARGVRPENILPGAGSSDLIFRALRGWLNPSSHALVLDPTYGEYAHVLERVIGCTVDRLTLGWQNGYQVDLQRLEAAFADHYDLIVLVNPNSPTGRHIRRPEFEALLARVPASTRVWIDETYVEYAGADQSLERFAAASENVVVCKSMSKVYALSGARVAYLCAGPQQLEALLAITPPWVVSLPAQLAAVRALQDPEYYADKYLETSQLRQEFARSLESLGCNVVPGIANFILCHLPDTAPEAAVVVHRCQKEGVFLRDARLMGSHLGPRALRIAVKDAATNQRIMKLLTSVISGKPARTPAK
jgi:histidinol-phosphate/aromatic aminotransferase/cobyric acid decarboxylase-like protein/GNAT superfamily N-acetyltransferase